jgi:hypothetical protein
LFRLDVTDAQKCAIAPSMTVDFPDQQCGIAAPIGISLATLAAKADRINAADNRSANKAIGPPALATTSACFGPALARLAGK